MYKKQYHDILSKQNIEIMTILEVTKKNVIKCKTVSGLLAQ